MHKIDALRKIKIFSALTDETLQQIQGMVVQRPYHADSTIIMHGDTSSATYLILKGAVRSTTFSTNGKEICFQLLEEGEIFGELSAIDDLPRTTSIIAETDCVLGILEPHQLWALMEQHPEIMSGVLKRLTSLVRFLCSRVYEYGALGTRDRTRAELLRMAKNNMIGENNAIITSMPTHESIANRIASHREAVTKEFSYLAKNGLIEKKGKTLLVPNIQALSALVMESIA